MQVLNSSNAFREHYSTRTGNVFAVAAAAGKGGVVAGGVAGTAVLAVGTAAAHASAWSMFAGWPLIGSFAAGNAAAAGVTAGMAALGSAVVLLPAAIIGGGVAYALYQKRQKTPIQKSSGVEELANAFARVACLPMLALAVSVCRADPSSVESVLGFISRELGAWGYAESYVRAGFEEAMRHSPEELNDGYEWAMCQLASGTTQGIGATPRELPSEAVRGFANEFREKFESCMG